MITSTANQQVKRIIQLQKKAKTRCEQRVFVVEGPKMVFEAPKEWVEQIYISESFRQDADQMRRLSEYSCTCEVLSDSIMRAVSDTQTPQGILALVRMPSYTLEELLGGRCLDMPDHKDSHLLILESIQDPGNLGTMFRTGEGAGVTGIIMNDTTVDVYNPKTVRATMGSLYRVPFYVTEDMKRTIGKLREQDIKVYAAHLKGSQTYDKPDYTGGTAFLIGNEGNGLTEEIAVLADEYIRIPMEGQVESLNAAFAATLLMYEAARQRR